ncbi:hypothetical protein N7478_000651 [Penicillium angulare]|uniref:uncharacterized protein n=1 Tax=Penicillium angulare TaxID=116970 RepID=UPI00254111FF|nr:uncharacterized protein N7478_000651 [Penicillium angulare]KAJ5291400.1 hypothetical protein N7478_000651 [Penicillium angulare]
MAKVVELLYETNRVLRDVVDFLVKQKDITPGDEVLQISDRLCSILAQQVRKYEPYTSSGAGEQSEINGKCEQDQQNRHISPLSDKLS